jgi:putative aminopeptidase FrvX
MKMFDSLKFIEEITDANGAPGFEDEVVEIIKQYVKPYTDDVKEDKMRNLFIKRKNHSGNKPIIMLDGHSDEVAFMITSINDNGSLNFMPLGGWHAQNVPAHTVRVRNNDGEYIIGIIASKPPHFMSDEEKNRLMPIKEMTIDIGASSYEEVVNEYKISVAAPVVPDVKFNYNESHDIMFGKAFDNRLGSACAVETLIELGEKELSVDVVSAVAAQEEIGTRGAEVTVRTVKPDVAIVFEGSPADDMDRSPKHAQCALKKGPQIRHRDRSMISNPRFTKWAKEIAKENGIEVQDAVRWAGGTNAGKIHLGNLAVPTIVIGIPTRYAHTHYCYSSYNDYKQAILWAKKIIENLTPEIIDSF